MIKLFMAAMMGLVLASCAPRDLGDTYRAVGGAVAGTALVIACSDAAGNEVKADGAAWAERHGLWADIGVTTAAAFRNAYCDAKGLRPVPLEKVPASKRLEDSAGMSIQPPGEMALGAALEAIKR